MNADFQTTIPLAGVEEGHLTQLVGNLSAVLGQPIEISKQYVLTTPSAKASLFLDDLRDTIKAERQNGKPHAKVARARKAPKAGKAKAAGKMGGHSWKVESTGQVISTQALRKLLAEGGGQELKGQ